MAIGVLILGESGTGKTYSMHNFNPDEVKILSVQKPILPFRGKYDITKTPTGEDVINEMKKTKKKVIVVDDFQYILGVPMLKRIGEKGWDKFNEIQQPYGEVLDALNDLPDDTIVFFNSHVMTNDDTGRVQIKTIGKALDKYITIEGLFMIVLGTSVVDGNYYFLTQNNGANTLKSPEGMFPSLAIPNDMKYVVDKIRNYYYMDGAKSDEEIAAEDEQNKVADEDLKKKRGRRSRTTEEETKEETEEVKKPRVRKKRTVEPAAVEPAESVNRYFRLDDGSVLMATEEPDNMTEEITEDEFNQALIEGQGQVAKRTRRKKEEPAEEAEREEVPWDEIDNHPELTPTPEEAGVKPRTSRRRRRG